MSIVISDELQQLFDLRDHRAAVIEKFIIAEAELQAHMQQNANKAFVEVHDLDLTNKLLKPVLELKEELEAVNAKFEQKKKFFISMLESTGCLKLSCTNKEFNADGDFQYVPYLISVVRKGDGESDLSIKSTAASHKG